MPPQLPIWAWLAVAYVAGSVPFAFLIGKAKGVDLRTCGSGNVGATNCGRVLGRPYGFACFALDVLKGFIPTGLAGFANGWLGRADLAQTDAWWWLAIAAAAVLGHMFPIWLKFKGGKGVATGLGVVLAIYPALTIPGLIGLAVWVVAVLLFRMVSLASVLAAITLPAALIAAILIQNRDLAASTPFITITALLAAFVIIRHRTNLARILAGKESRIGDPVEKTDQSG